MKFSSADRYYLKTVFLLLLICFLVYFNSLKSPFQFDDVKFIEENPYIKSVPIFFEQFGIHRLLQRSILVFTYTLNYELGRDNTIGYHFVNLFIHFGVCLLVFLIVGKVLQHLNRRYGLPRRRDVPLIATLLFATHPIQSQSVTYLMSRSASLATFFYLAAFYSFMILLDMKYFEGHRPLKKIQITFQAGLIFLFTILGLGTKLIVISLPLVMVLYFILIIFPEGETWKSFLQKEYKFLLPIVATLSIFIIYKAFFSKHGLFKLSGFEALQFTRWDYLLSQIKWLFFYYLKAFLFPINLNLDPDVRTLESWAEPMFILSAILFIFILFQVRSGSRWFLLGIAWFILTIAPESSFVPLQDVVAEHRMYLPSVGLFFIVAWLFNRSQIVIFCCCVLLFFAANLIHRNHDWRSKISLWEDTVKKSPKKARPFINLAHAYQKSEHLEEAIINYKKAAARDRGYFPIHHNLGVLYKGMGRCELAEEEYRLALILKPNSGESMVGLAECFSQAGKYHLAVQMLEKVLRVGPRLGSAYRVLGKINYFHLGQKEIGKDYFRKALALDPTHEQNSILKNLVGNEPK